MRAAAQGGGARGGWSPTMAMTVQRRQVGGAGGCAARDAPTQPLRQIAPAVAPHRADPHGGIGSQRALRRTPLRGGCAPLAGATG